MQEVHHYGHSDFLILCLEDASILFEIYEEWQCVCRCAIDAVMSSVM
jgi:hypothetical protein